MPTRAIRVWNASASAWESVGIEAPDTSIFLTYSWNEENQSWDTVV